MKVYNDTNSMIRKSLIGNTSCKIVPLVVLDMAHKLLFLLFGNFLDIHTIYYVITGARVNEKKPLLYLYSIIYGDVQNKNDIIVNLK